ncbi:MAG: ABC transporter permease [Erysipelotrichaceae bacterium]|uniref:ABC transporter permease n=1 Tax=Floccifex sp. TaxID=2815810 RepID=UPI0029FF0969|nr:ABC transporter permease subunit [Floccifex sp.]MDD7281159.1 ABC transporter permease [Erysipelotrichaceae bacterium]MDY2958793.1 ABC transporter permease [Floccifex sp.]
MKKKKILIPLVVFICVIFLWEGCVKLFDISLYILPAPSMILKAIISNFSVLWMHSMVTLKEALIGLFISTLLAIFIAIGMDLSKTFKSSVYPFLIVTQTVPVMVLGPLFSIWLGFGMAPKVLIVIFMCFFPIAISFCDALGQVDLKQINLLKSFGANTFQIYKMVKIPAGAIGLFSGLKVAATYCIGGAIVGEWLSSSAGLGYYMLRVKNGYMLDKVFACVVVIILWSILLNGVVTLIEYILFPHLKKGEKK